MRTAPRWLSVVVGLGALLAFGGLLVYAYGDAFLNPVAEDIPLIAREPGPERIRPADPGGRKIPYRDMEILKAQSGERSPAPVAERVLPPPEKPVDPSTLIPAAGDAAPPRRDPAAPADPASATGPAADLDAGAGPGTSEDPVPVAGPDRRAVADAGTDEPGGEPVVAVPLPRPRPFASAAVPVARVESGVLPRLRPFSGRAVHGPGGRIQVGAVRGRDDAIIVWQELRARHPAELGDLTLRLEQSGGEDGYFRLLAGPVSAARARQICRTLVSHGQTCLLDSP
ncbi:MAG: SPOR domain-containing protein [Alphaproteobacteria bacterium]|nr:SPOR domain-containing protein [Alphaproteobacteria bacterium]